MNMKWKYGTGCGGTRTYQLAGTEYEINKESCFYIYHPTDREARLRGFDFLRDAKQYCEQRAVSLSGAAG